VQFSNVPSTLFSLLIPKYSQHLRTQSALDLSIKTKVRTCRSCQCQTDDTQDSRDKLQEELRRPEGSQGETAIITHEATDTEAKERKKNLSDGKRGKSRHEATSQRPGRGSVFKASRRGRRRGGWACEGVEPIIPGVSSHNGRPRDRRTWLLMLRIALSYRFDIGGRSSQLGGGGR
jgi:hypothetical protein